MILDKGICSASVFPRDGYSPLEIISILEKLGEVRNTVLIEGTRVSVAFWFILSNEEFQELSSYLFKFGHIIGQNPQGLDA